MPPPWGSGQECGRVDVKACPSSGKSGWEGLPAAAQPLIPGLSRGRKPARREPSARDFSGGHGWGRVSQGPTPTQRCDPAQIRSPSEPRASQVWSGG